MVDAALNNLKQAVLSRVELHGIEAAQSYCEAFPPLSVERRHVQRVFVLLVSVREVVESLAVA